MRAFDGPRDRPFTVHRVFEGLVLLWSILEWCSASDGSWGCAATWGRRPSWVNTPLTALLSILSVTSLVPDLLALNVLVYPAVVAMETVILEVGSDDDGRAYFLSSFLLLGGIGALSNLAASFLTGRGVSGIRGSAAAAVGYLLAARPGRTVVTVLGISMVPSDVLVGTAALGALPVPGQWSVGTLCAWVIGGLLGKLLGNHHTDKYGPLVFSFF